MEKVQRFQLGKDNPEEIWEVVNSPGKDNQIRPTQWILEPGQAQGIGEGLRRVGSDRFSQLRCDKKSDLVYG